MAATRIQCGFMGCEYVSESESEQVALIQFQSHMAAHQQPPQARASTTKQKLPRIERPTLKQDVSEEEWDSFNQEWKRFRRCTDIPAGQEADQLFDCSERGLGRLLLKEDPDIIGAGEKALLDAMKEDGCHKDHNQRASYQDTLIAARPRPEYQRILCQREGSSIYMQLLCKMWSRMLCGCS